MALGHSNEGGSNVLLYRNPDVLFAMHQEFEAKWKVMAEADDDTPGIEPARPEGFPPQFKSRFALSAWMRGASDDDVWELMNTWRKHPKIIVAELDSRAIAANLSPYTGQPLQPHVATVRQQVIDAVTPDEAAMFPRIFKEQQDDAA